MGIKRPSSQHCAMQSVCCVALISSETKIIKKKKKKSSVLDEITGKISLIVITSSFQLTEICFVIQVF